MLRDVLSSDGIDVLERVIRFSGRRHAIIANNIANVSTPGFTPTDLDPRQFQALLAKAIERQQVRRGEERPVRRGSSGAVPASSDDSEAIGPRARRDNLLFHDRNDRDIERLMQDLAENVMVHRQATEILRTRYGLLETAIRERV